MKPRSCLLLLCIALALPAVTWSASPTPVGFWLIQDGSAVVRIEESGGRLSGRTLWMQEPNYPAGDTQGRAGKPKVDEFNSDPANRARKRLGMQVVWGFSPPNDKGVCEDGQVYDPRSGKTYSGTITMVGSDRLELRGYVLVSMIGKTTTWTRVDPATYGLKP